MRLSCQDESTDAQHELFGQGLVEFRTNFKLDLLRLTGTLLRRVLYAENFMVIE